MAGIFTYSRISGLMRDPPGQRKSSQLAILDPWFRKKAQMFASLDPETLLDVIQHCDFVTRNRDDVIILQGEKGHRFFIVLRGSVSVMLKDSVEDIELGEEKLEARIMERAQLGTSVVTLGEGATFGELALIHPDCVRTASIVAEEKTDLVVIHRDLYNRSVSKVIAREYAEKMAFIDSVPLLHSWPQKLKRQLAVCFRREVFNFDSYIVRQGDPVQDVYFIVNGEVKLKVDPEAHYSQFERFIRKCTTLIEDSEDATQNERAYFPQKLLPQLQKYTRITKASMMNHTSTASSAGFPLAWSPSAIRKMNLQMNHKRVSVNLCFLGEGQMLSDAEMLLNLDTHHASAMCSRETTVMVLHRNHFDRLFRKKTPQSIKVMTQLVETQLTMRCLKTNILETVPLLRCMLFKIQELNGERKPGDEKGFMTSLRAHALESEKVSPVNGQSVLPAAGKHLLQHGHIMTRAKTLVIPKIDV